MIFTTSTFKKFKTGDNKAFKKLYNKHYDSLYRFGLSFLSQQDEVEDILQEAFIKAWGLKNEFENENNFKSFLYTFIKNSCLNKIKHLKIKDKYKIYKAKTDITELDFQKQVMQEELVSNIQKELERLPKAAREVYLRSLDGLKNQEIAEDLGISINTVKLYKKNSKNQIQKRVINL